MKTKTCSKCKQTKDIGEFHKNKSKKDGLDIRCKSCVSERNKAYRQENKEEIAEYQKAYRQKNKEKIAERKKAWYQENKEKTAERRKVYRQENKEKIKAYRQKNKEAIAERRKAYYQENKEEITERQKAYRQENKEEIAEYKQRNKFIINLQNRFIFSVKKIGDNEEICCDFYEALGLNNSEEVFDYLSQKFYPHPITGEEMTSENYGRGDDCWQIDHKIPFCQAKNIQDVIDQTYYTNLQPLWTIDHKKKTASEINSN